MNVPFSTDMKKYLGLPNRVGRKKKRAFQHLKDGLRQKINSWSIRVLSLGGKEVFIKAVWKAIPIYMMACFLLPKSLCLELENIISSFWWQKGQGRRGMHRCDWKGLSGLKEDGGMGFRNLSLFNIALLAKRGYMGCKGITQERIGMEDWRWPASIHPGRCVWVPELEEVRIQSPIFNEGLIKVADLIDTVTRRWNAELIYNTFPVRVAELILSIPLSLSTHVDQLTWSGEPTGECTRSEVGTRFFYKKARINYRLVTNNFTSDFGA
ncbi:uncharacterized protein LOC128280487 [Gossypium arboreum]|uniref:uncharacterized protein LOC128280487 n=1 Tax=Gossypium arboreum TaxID=29729 RepID=UPI0022F182EE|nr:uncharacterized protein LOC128280487 [Gossypium arboreum]